MGKKNLKAEKPITKVRSNPEIKDIIWNGEPIPNTNFAEFKDKQFARYFLMTKGDLKKAFEMTYGKAGSIEEMDAVLNRVSVKKEIEKLLPSDQEIARVLAQALNAKTPDYIRWGEKHAFLDTILKLKGYTKADEGNKTQVNIGMVIEK